MKTIETLITEIKNNTKNTNKLRLSIKEQIEEVMEKVRMDLENEGIYCEPKRNQDSDIYIGNDFHHNIRISLGGGNFRIDLPNIHKTPNAHIQFVIFRVLSKYEEAVMNIQLDMVNEIKIDKYDTIDELACMITEMMISSLLEGNSIKCDGKSYKYVETKKGRYVVDITKIVMFGDEKPVETKSYTKAQLEGYFKSSARNKAKALTNI